MAKKKYYAVLRGKTPGIYRSWPETEAQVKGFAGARYKGFATEVEAKQWLSSGGSGKTGESGKRGNGSVRKNSPVETTARKGEVVVYTDGGAIGNPGPGGYGVVIVSENGSRELSAGYRHTTNNRMELLACIAALRELRGRPEKISLFSDSSYVVNGMIKGWAVKWRKNGWLKSDRKPVLNQDLWQELLELTESLDVELRWVRGHAGNPLNERCDQLAQASARGDAYNVDMEYEEGDSLG